MDYTVTEIEAEFTSARRTAVSNSTEQNKQKVINYSIFNLPSNFLNSSRFIESLSTPELTTATTTEVIAETTKEKNYNFSERLTCNCCNSSFDSLHDQRSHFKSDFHRFNIKLSIAGKNIIKEEDFNELSPDSLVEDYEISSISGSEDEYDSDHDCKSDTIKGFFRSRKQKIYLRVPNGETVSFWKCLILGDLEKTRFENDSMKDDDTFSVSMSEVTDKLLSVIHETRNNIHLRVMLLVSGGHFAGCVFDGNSVVAHKAFHRYVIRAKAGKKQSSKDGSGKTAHSAGASIRRHNELALKKDIRELLAAWKLYFDASVCIFIHAPSHNRKLIFDGENPYFSCHNRSIIRHIPLTVRRPTLSEAQRLYKILTQISLEPNEDIIPIIKEDSTRTLGKENQRNNVENEASLSGVEPLMQKIHSEIRVVDAEILAAVRQQSNSGTKAKEDLAAATRAVEELMYKVREIKTKAEQSETMVQEICRDIKKLDSAKKHITTTITALHRLTMLVSAIEQLQVMASKRRYKEAAAQLEAVNQLCSHFDAYKDIPKITELRDKFKNIKQILKSHVFSDFSSLGTGKEAEETNLLQHLSDACLVVDALEPSVREELVKNFCNRELISYQQIFEGAELAKLDKTERRYAWVKRRLRTNEEIWKTFPASWHVDYLMCIQFCKLTRAQLMEIFQNLKEKPDVGTLLLALQRTIEFEEELAEKFGSSGNSKSVITDIVEVDKGENNNQIVMDIRKKYEKKLAAHQGNQDDDKGVNKDFAVPGAGFNFRGIISSCFEPHLMVYVELEERTLMEHLEKLVQDETWDMDDGSQTNILSSSMQVFLIIRRSLKRCCALTRNQTLLNLFKVFQRVLRAYATKLFMKLPKGGMGIVAAATGMDGHVKTSDKDERLICYIVNTAEYCHKTAGELADNVSKIIDSQLIDSVDMSAVQDEFSAVITKALITLVHGVETKFDIEMGAMTRVPWGTLESVGDQSEYVNSINMILSGSVPTLGSLLSPIYFQFFLDKLASSLGPRFYLNVFKCKQISETGAQQMLLDTQAVKTILLDIPSLGRQATGAVGYAKFVSREMSKAEALLKVILSPIDSVADTYGALLPEGTPSEFQRILELKGLKKADQQTILDDFNKRGSGMPESPVATHAVQVAVAPVPPPMATATSSAVIASREDVLTRAAALGRGAATTGFKRFLALTEAAKDRKDGPFRKLFNA